MPIDSNLLPDPANYFKVQGLTLKGSRSNKWKTAACYFHGGSDSMRVNLVTGAWVCMSCGEKGRNVLDYEIRDGGQDFVVAAQALGCWVDDGRPPVQTKPIALSPQEKPSGESNLDREFHLLRAALALHGHELRRTDPADGIVTYFARHRGFVRTVHTIASVRWLLGVIERRL